MKLALFTLVFATSLFTNLAATAGGKETRQTSGPEMVHPALAAPPVVVAQRSVEPLAYLLAWRNAADATHHTDALQLTQTMADLVALPAGPAHDALERLLDAELAANPGRFDPSTPIETLSQLLRENVGGFQRILSPALSEAGYARYQKLLDSLNIEAN
jgi:hypothetical protein